MTDPPIQPWIDRKGFGLLTDLYELTMMAGYLAEDRAHRQVCFEYFFRDLPPNAGFAISAGLDSLLSYLENLRFYEDDIEYLRNRGTFDEKFFEWMRDFRPSCTVRAIDEGALVYPHEPIIQAEGDIIEVQMLETALLCLMNYPTLLATKAARIALAANNDPVLEFGLRRAHGPDGGLTGSRACYIGGCTSTSNVLAGKVYDIPIAGTHAHSWVMSFDSELDAFRAFARQFPDICVLLVDTYDTIESGVPNAIKVFDEMRDEGIDFRPSIRLDSGDLAKLSKQAHKMLVDAGYEDPLIVASSDLEEDLVADLKRQGAKINAWGVGTNLITASDDPSLNGVYKLVAVRDGDAWEPKLKISSSISKSTSPGKKELVRYFDRNDAPIADVYYAPGEEIPEQGTIYGRDRVQSQFSVRIPETARSERLLKTVFQNGKRVEERKSVTKIRDYAMNQVKALPEEYKRLRNPEIYRVLMSEKVGQIRNDLFKEHGETL